MIKPCGVSWCSAWRSLAFLPAKTACLSACAARRVAMPKRTASEAAATDAGDDEVRIGSQ